MKKHETPSERKSSSAPNPLHTFLNIGLGTAWGLLGLSVFYGKAEAVDRMSPPVSECRMQSVPVKPGSVSYGLNVESLRRNAVKRS